MSHEQQPDEFIDEIRARQRNIVFPDTVRNGRSVDAFFWNGSPNPTLVQRIAAWLFCSVFICLGLAFILLTARARDDHDWIGYGVMLLISLASVAVGIKIFRNGFPRKRG